MPRGIGCPAPWGAQLMDTSGTSPDERRPERLALPLFLGGSRVVSPGRLWKVFLYGLSSLDDPGLCSDRLWAFAVGIYSSASMMGVRCRPQLCPLLVISEMECWNLIYERTGASLDDKRVVFPSPGKPPKIRPCGPAVATRPKLP